jgi:hypothetical protein
LLSLRLDFWRVCAPVNSSIHGFLVMSLLVDLLVSIA